MTAQRSSVRRIGTFAGNVIQGLGYFDRADVLWHALMVCDGCGRRGIDDDCADCLEYGCQSARADDRLAQIGRDLAAASRRIDDAHEWHGGAAGSFADEGCAQCCAIDEAVR